MMAQKNSLMMHRQENQIDGKHIIEVLLKWNEKGEACGFHRSFS